MFSNHWFLWIVPHNLSRSLSFLLIFVLICMHFTSTWILIQIFFSTNSDLFAVKALMATFLCTETNEEEKKCVQNLAQFINWMGILKLKKKTEIMCECSKVKFFFFMFSSSQHSDRFVCTSCKWMVLFRLCIRHCEQSKRLSTERRNERKKSSIN